MEMYDLLILAVLSAVILGVYIYKKYSARVLQRKLNNAKRSSLKAIELLEERGYTIIDCDRRVQLVSLIDGKTYNDVWGMDFLVRKGRTNYLVKISSGGQSSRLGYRENREALLGSVAVFGCPRLLLIDPERRQIRILKSSVIRPAAQRFSRLLTYGAIFLLGALSSLALWYFLSP